MSIFGPDFTAPFAPEATSVQALKFLLEVHEANGNLVCMLENAFNASWTRRINEIGVLTFSLPSSDTKSSELIGGREVWLWRKDSSGAWALADIFIIRERNTARGR